HSLALSIVLICAAHSATAQHEFVKSNWDGVRLAQNDRGGARISMGQAMEIVQRSTGGRVLNAQEVNSDGRTGYRIKVITRSGEVRVVFVDARSGAMQQD